MKLLANFSFVFVFLLFFNSSQCQSDQSYKVIWGIASYAPQKIDDSICLDEFPHIDREWNIQNLVRLLSRGDVVYESSVGIGGRCQEEYAAFEKLNQLASDRQLFKLLRAGSPTLRVYSYKCLVRRKTKLPDWTIRQMANDKDLVTNLSGCTGLRVPVSFFYTCDFEFLLATEKN